MTDDTDDADDLHPVDADALRRCLEIARREPGRREQLDSFLNGEPFIPARPWIEVATFAAQCVQGRALKLKPWQTAPCNLPADGAVGDDDVGGQVLLNQMIDAGLSIWEPNPIPDIFQVDYEQEGDDVCVYLWFADDFNNGNPIIASMPSNELVDRDMFESALHLRFGCRKALRATA